MGEKGPKVQVSSNKVNKSWRCNVKPDDFKLYRIEELISREERGRRVSKKFIWKLLLPSPYSLSGRV